MLTLAFAMASANSFWFTPHRLGTTALHFLWQFILQSTKRKFRIHWRRAAHHWYKKINFTVILIIIKFGELLFWIFTKNYSWSERLLQALERVNKNVSFSGLKIYVQAQVFDSLTECLSSGVGRFCHMIKTVSSWQFPNTLKVVEKKLMLLYNYYTYSVHEQSKDLKEFTWKPTLAF